MWVRVADTHTHCWPLHAVLAGLCSNAWLTSIAPGQISHLPARSPLAPSCRSAMPWVMPAWHACRDVA